MTDRAPQSPLYSEVALDHFLNPRNVGQVPSFEGIGRVKSSVCQDLLEVTVRREVDGALVTAFRAQACSACIAAASLLTEWVNGERLAEPAARAIDAPALTRRLGGMPAGKRPCVAMAPVALARALDAIET
jgi:nitrogen fixation NifU-like protein